MFLSFKKGIPIVLRIFIEQKLDLYASLFVCLSVKAIWAVIGSFTFETTHCDWSEVKAVIGFSNWFFTGIGQIDQKCKVEYL